MSPKTLSIVVIALASTVGLAGQQLPTFRAEANFVELDAIVTDHQGQFVPGLSASDFIIHEGGATQPVETFDVVNLPRPGQRATSASAPSRLSPTIGVPSGALNGRIYLFYFDIPASGIGTIKARALAKDFITNYMQAGDTAAVWDATSLGSTISFTDDRTALLKAVSQVDGGDGNPGSQAFVDPTGRLRDAADLLNSIQGRRKSLLLFSTGLPSYGVSRSFNRLNPAYWLPAESDLRFAMESATRPGPLDVAGLADVHIYTIDVRGLLPPANAPGVSSQSAQLSGQAEADRVLDQMTSVDDLRSIADATGGVSIVATNSFSEGFHQIVQDNSEYYVLGYRSARSGTHPGFVPVTVETNRTGLTVRARNGYLAR